MPEEHKIKLSSKYFDDVKSGRKSFEIRKNDRNYRVNDILIMQEYTKSGEYTDRYIEAVIIYMLEDGNYLKDGYVALGIEVLMT